VLWQFPALLAIAGPESLGDSLSAIKSFRAACARSAGRGFTSSVSPLNFEEMSYLESLAQLVLPSLSKPPFASLPVLQRGEAAAVLRQEALTLATTPEQHWPPPSCVYTCHCPPPVAKCDYDPYARAYPMVCFRANAHEALTGEPLRIIGQHLRDSYPLPLRTVFSPWSLHNHLVGIASSRWWNVWATIDLTEWNTDIGRAELYARQVRQLRCSYCPLSRVGLDTWKRNFHICAAEIPTLLKEQMMVLVATLPDLSQCKGFIAANREAGQYPRPRHTAEYPFQRHAADKACDENDSEGEDVFDSGRFHSMCRAKKIK